MEAKHTPGPWQVWNFCGDSEIDVAVGPEIGGVAVAQIVTCNAHGIATASTMEAGQANARLIAAAPELLEALWAMVTSFHAVEYMEPHMQEAAKRARAAIAKAEGRA